LIRRRSWFRRSIPVLAALLLITPMFALGMAAVDGDGAEAADFGSRWLYHGVRGSDVADLQAFLNSAGFPAGPVDGIFGPLTRGGVMAFQRVVGILIDGVVGPQTFGAITQWKQTNAPRADKPLVGKTIVVDPGHGGYYTGAVGKNGVAESINVLAIGLKLRNLLKAAGAKVIMTRTTDDYPRVADAPWAGQLAARTITANRSDADIFVSIHNNVYKDPAVRGMMTFYYGGSNDEALARHVQAGLVAKTGGQNRGIHRRSFYVLRNTKMPSVLVEAGFLSNATDAWLLTTDDYRLKIAQGIYTGVLSYFKDK